MNFDRSLLCGFLFLLGAGSLLPFALSAQLFQREDLARVTGVVADRYSGIGLKATINYVMFPYWEQTGLVYSEDSTGAFEIYLVKDRTYQLEVVHDDYFTFPAQFWIRQDTNQDFLLTPRPKDVFRLEHLIFEQSKSNILPASYRELDDLVVRMRMHRAMVIQLEGHTDITGNSDANMTLSEERVREVKQYLVKQGIKANRILTQAYGDTHPLTQDRTEEGQQLNRRVEVRIMGSE